MSPQFNDDSDYENAWLEESWTAHGGQPVGYIPPMYTDICVFVDGEHVYMGEGCPHQDGGDDIEFPPGWTVLNN